MRRDRDKFEGDFVPDAARPGGSFDGDWPENEAPLPSGHDAGSMRIPGHLVDRFFDREMTRAEASGMFETFRADPDAARRFVQTQRMLDALREPVKAPDLSRQILAEVDRRTPMLTRRGVRHVRLGRVAAAAALVAIIAGAFVAQRFNPGIVEVGSAEPRPLASLRSLVTQDAADAVNTLQQTARAVEFTASRAVTLTASPAPAPGERAAPAVFVRARLLPEALFPWRQQSEAPSASPAVAWVVPCGTAPGASALSDDERACGSKLILIDMKPASVQLPQAPRGRSNIAK